MMPKFYRYNYLKLNKMEIILHLLLNCLSHDREKLKMLGLVVRVNLVILNMN